MESKATKDSLPPIPAKRYFTIGEVSELCGVKPHVLRYWEQEFTQLRPVKRRGNRRYYQHHEVLLIRRIRELLYEQGFTISGVTRIDTDLVCVNVIPQRLKSGDENNGALTTPLSLAGTPKELDEELPKQLVEFVHSHLQLSSTLKSAKEEMEAAAKAAREAARKSTPTKARASTKECAPAKENPGTASDVRTPEAKSIVASDDASEDPAGVGTSSLAADVPTSGDLFGHPGVEH